MLSESDLKTWLQRDLNRLDKLLLILASLDSPCQIRDLKERALEVGFRIRNNWNISDILRRSKGLAIRTPRGWEISKTGTDRLRTLGISTINPAAVQVATDLRAELNKVYRGNIRSFIDEAIKCYESRLYRSAVVMSWIGAVAVLHDHIFVGHLAAFNAESRRVNARWRDAKTTDELSRMSEADFLDRITALSIIGRDVKKELRVCLDRRNSCGHPNSLEIGGNAAAHHIETLLLNVFQKF